MRSGKGGVQNELSAGVVIGQTILGRDVTVVLPPQVRPELSGLPRASRAFAGRRGDLDALLRELEPGRAETDEDEVAAPVVAVGGLAGVGKTELAVQAAHAGTARGWFPGGVLFADLFDYDDDLRRGPGDVLEGMLTTLGVPGEYVPAHAHDRSRMFTSILARFAAEGRRVLVIVDNVSSGEHAELLLPTDGTSAAVVTSRHTLAMLDARLLELDVLAPADAVAMLDKTVRMLRRRDACVRADPDGAAELAEVCGRLPQALRIAAAQLGADRHQTPAGLARELREVRPLEGLTFDRDGVRRAFELSYRALTDVQQRLFRLFTVNPGPQVGTEAVAALAGTGRGQVRTLLRELERAHLIEGGTVPGWWRMHDLIRQYATGLGLTNAAQDERGKAFARLLLYYLHSAIAASAHLGSEAAASRLGADSKPADLNIEVFTDRTQALAWLDAQFTNLVAVTRLAGSDPSLSWIAQSLPDLMWKFLMLRRDFSNWISLANISLQASRSLNDRAGEARALYNLGIALYESHRFEEAVAALEKSAGISGENGDRRAEVSALVSLGIALLGTRRFVESVRVLRTAAAHYASTGERRGEGAALGNLGFALYEMEAFEESITMLRRALDIFREFSDRQAEGAALNNLGNALRDTHRFDEAITVYNDAIAISEEFGDRYTEACTRDNLGNALKAAGRHEEAISAHQEAIAILRETGARRDEGDAHHNLGNAMARMGRLEEAITAQRDAVVLYAEIDDRHNMATTLCTLALLLAKADREEDALTACRDSIALFEETGDHLGRKKAQAALAVIRGQGDPSPED